MIPYFKPTYTDADRWALGDGLQATMKPGWAVEALEYRIAKRLGIHPAQVLCTNSCTAALQLAFMGWNYCVRPNPTWFRIQAPALTWVSTYNWASPRARRVVDVDRRTLMPRWEESDYSTLRYLVDLWGRRIVPDSIPDLVGKRPFVLDAAHNLFDPWHKDILRYPNCFGICYSFFHTKQISTVRGGALILPTQCQYRDRIEAFRDSGTLGRELVEAQGWNFEMEDANASLGLLQLERFDEWQDKCRRILQTYRRELMGTDQSCSIEGESGHLAIYKTKTITETRAVQAALKQADVAVGEHYPVYRWYPDQYPDATHVSRRITTLPCYPTLTEEEQQTVIDAIRAGRSTGSAVGRKRRTSTTAPGKATKQPVC